jgi:hypothetical protein
MSTFSWRQYTAPQQHTLNTLSRSLVSLVPSIRLLTFGVKRQFTFRLPPGTTRNTNARVVVQVWVTQELILPPLPPRMVMMLFLRRHGQLPFSVTAVKSLENVT